MKKKLLFLVAALALFVPSVMAAEKTAGTEEELTKALSEAVTGDTIKLKVKKNLHLILIIIILLVTVKQH